MLLKNSCLLSVILVIILSLSSCGKKEDASVEELIAKKWMFSKIEKNKQDIQTSFDSLDALSFIHAEENTFTFRLLNENINSHGKWFLENDSILTIIYALSDTTINIDSTVYYVNNNQALLDLYSQGNKIAFIDNNSFDGYHYIEQLIIKEVSESVLVILYNDQLINLNYNKSLSSISFSISSLIRGLIGMLVVIALAFLFSANRRAISWRVVATGLIIQITLAIGVLKVPFIQKIFEGVSGFFIVILDFTREGSVFLLGGMMDISSYGFIFAFQVLPTIIFFSALTSVLFYLGIIQKIVYGLAWVMTKVMKLSGAESLSVAGNIFLGQTESPLMIKAYLPKMNKSEILLVMIGGMATIAGGVLAAYISFLGGDDPVMRMYFAKHLLTASVMAAPGAVVAAKILMPQTEDVNKNIEITQDKIGSNILDAIANGTSEGLKLAVNVAAMLLVFIAFIALINYILNDFIGAHTGLNILIANMTNGQYTAFNLQFILGYTFSPLMWAIGVPVEDMTLVGRLLGEKIIMSEFIAYISLAELKDSLSFTHEKSIIMATYMLCGFANFASIGIQIGGIGSLAPNQRTLLSKFGIRALIGGSIASLFSATVVGMLM